MLSQVVCYLCSFDRYNIFLITMCDLIESLENEDRAKENSPVLGSSHSLRLHREAAFA